jgi:hypothetical protein
MVTSGGDQNGVFSECRGTNHRFQRRERRIRVHQHVSGGISRRRGSEHRLFGHLSQLALRASMPYIAVSPSASILPGARAGNAHKSAAFLEEERLIADVLAPAWLVNRVNRAQASAITSRNCRLLTWMLRKWLRYWLVRPARLRLCLLARRRRTCQFGPSLGRAISTTFNCFRTW